MSEHVSHTPDVRRLERSASDKWVAGVCGGLGRYFELNPTVFRLGLVVLTLLGGAGILVYIAAALVLPAEGREASIAEDVLRQRRDRPARLIGLGLVAAALFVLLSQAHTWPAAGAAWVLVLIAGLAILWASRDRSVRRLVLAVTTFVVALVVTAIVAVIASFAWFDVSLDDGIGERTYRPASIAETQQRYELGIGDLEVDLRHLPAGRDAHVRAKLGIGELRVIVPQTVDVVARTHVKAGDTTGPEQTVVNGERTVYLDLDVGAGHIDIERR